VVIPELHPFLQDTLVLVQSHHLKLIYLPSILHCFVPNQEWKLHRLLFAEWLVIKELENEMDNFVSQIKQNKTTKLKFKMDTKGKNQE